MMNTLKSDSMFMSAIGYTSSTKPKTMRSVIFNAVFGFADTTTSVLRENPFCGTLAIGLRPA